MILIDFENIVLNNIPPHLRKALRLVWLKVLYSGLLSIYNSFLSFRDSSNYQLSLRGQTIYLEKILNEKFDSTNNGISINNLDPADFIFVANNDSNISSPWLSNTSGADEIELGDLAYYNGLHDFEIEVPASVYSSLNQNEMRAIVNQYIYSSMNYEIISL